MVNNDKEKFFDLDDPEIESKLSAQTIEQFKKLENTRLIMKRLCNSLSVDNSEFNKEEIMMLLHIFINDKSQYLKRLLYSELSNYMFDLNNQDQSNFLSNLDRMLEHIVYLRNREDSTEVDDIEKIMTKIYDHYYLVQNQMGMVQRKVDDGVKRTREENQKEIRILQKDYIAILSIFSAVVLAFSGGLTFSASVLENISDASIYKLIIVALIIGLVLINLFFGLFYYINKILDKEDNLKPLKWSNIIFLVLTIIVSLIWFANVHEIQDSQQANAGNMQVNYYEAK